MGESSSKVVSPSAVDHANFGISKVTGFGAQAVEIAPSRPGARPRSVPIQRPQNLRQRLRQILGDEPRAEGAGGGAVQPDGGRRGDEGRRAPSGEAGDKASEHVARAGGGQRRRQVPADRGAAVGRGDDGVGALEDNDRAGQLRRGAGALELVVAGVDAGRVGEEAGELAFMRASSPRHGHRA